MRNVFSTAHVPYAATLPQNVSETIAIRKPANTFREYIEILQQALPAI
jgi:hypothetical protein